MNDLQPLRNKEGDTSIQRPIRGNEFLHILYVTLCNVKNKMKLERHWRKILFLVLKRTEFTGFIFSTVREQPGVPR